MRSAPGHPFIKRAAAMLAALLLVGCSSPKGKGPDSPVLATVNGTPITVRQFKDRTDFLRLGFSNLSAGGPHEGEAKMDLLGQLIEEEMYLQEARRLNIAPTAPEVEGRLRKAMADYPGGAFEKTLKREGMALDKYKEELAKRLTVEDLINSQAYAKTKVGKADLLKYFGKHKDEFRRPLRVRARQIVVDNKAEADSILRELRKGADFQALARKRSLSPDSAMGGDLGYFSRGDMPPEFEAVVFKMRPGEISQVVKSPYGYHIFKLEELQKAKSPAFEEVEPEVRKRFLTEAGEDEFERWQEGLKGRTQIKINTDILGRL
jgi:peptidyl-prolyl cis-trans isomerase C